MHEMAVAQSLLSIIQQEMERHGATRLLAVRVKHGTLAGIVPQALEFAFQTLTVGTPLEGARLEMLEVPLKLACFECGHEFSPEAPEAGPRNLPLVTPCPACGEEIGHRVVQGKELFLDHLEVE